MAAPDGAAMAAGSGVEIGVEHRRHEVRGKGFLGPPDYWR
jgi:hypothetical protein